MAHIHNGIIITYKEWWKIVQFVVMWKDLENYKAQILVRWRDLNTECSLTPMQNINKLKQYQMPKTNRNWDKLFRGKFLMDRDVAD